jgi:hypothetical protein
MQLNNSTVKFRQALTALYTRVNALQRGEKRCFDVTLSQCVTLELLHQEGPKTVQEIALGLDASTVTRTLDVRVAALHELPEATEVPGWPRTRRAPIDPP